MTASRSALLLFALLAGTALSAGDGEKKTLRVYHVGNSVTDTIRYEGLAQLARARGHTHVWGRHMIPGAPLAWIWTHPDQGFQQPPFGHYPRALKEYAWDVLTLQPFDRQLDKGDDSDLTLCRRFIDLARQKSPDVQVYIYSRWPRRDEPKKGEYRLDYEKKWLRQYTGGWDGSNETRDYFERLVAALNRAYPDQKKPVKLIPVGDVLLELERRMKAGKVPGHDSVAGFYSDGIHFNAAGSYVVGCTFYATLYRDNPVGLPAAPYKLDDARLAKAIQEAVREVVTNHPRAGVAPPRGGRR